MKSERYFGGRKINLTILKRKRKSIKIEISSAEMIVVTAPNFVKADEIEKLLEKKSRWIEKTLKRLSENPSKPEKNYLSGEKHYFLGNEYAINVKHNNFDLVKIIKDEIVIFSRKPDLPEHTKTLLNRWYRLEGEKIFLEIARKYERYINHPQIVMPELSVRIMKRRWGTCYPTRRKILLSTELVKQPIPAIESVVVHELVHLKHPGHGKDFYQFLTEVMPDWKERSVLLKSR